MAGGWPFLIALPVLLATYRRFRFTDGVYVLIVIHACVLFLGRHYTYAEVPSASGRSECWGWRATTTTGWGTSSRASSRRW